MCVYVCVYVVYVYVSWDVLKKRYFRQSSDLTVTHEDEHAGHVKWTYERDSTVYGTYSGSLKAFHAGFPITITVPGVVVMSTVLYM